MNYYARKPKHSENKEDWQKLEDHLRGVAIRAKEFAEAFGLTGWGYQAGLWHDLGKYNDRFQMRLNNDKIKVDHSTKGAQFAASIFNNISRNEDYIAKILGYVIAGHHAGLPDGINTDNTCLKKRLKKELHGRIKEVEILEDIRAIPLISVFDLLPFFDNRIDNSDYAFGAAFLIRMLFSTLVDADRLDSEAFCDPQQAEKRKMFTDIKHLDACFFKRYYVKFSQKEMSTVNKARRTVFEDCLRYAEMPKGFFSLTVPTGGGKTLSSMAFALKHALKHKLRRIIYVIPYTSIIEQNAKIFREFLGDDAVVEHHSNFEMPRESDDDYHLSLASENWDAPVIVTTGVQFFESLFANKASRCRKLHNIADSVIILDESQMMPVEFLHPCIAALKELVRSYGTTVVLCTATQPALGELEGFKKGINKVHEIIDRKDELFSQLKRVTISFVGKYSYEKLTEKTANENRFLCIVNTRKHAYQLYQSIKLKTEDIFHLSANMCPRHRLSVINTIKERLHDHSLNCRVVSTQLIEAGVDIDFPVVFREFAGLDSIAQAAGRCNREGRLSYPGKLYVFDMEDGNASLFRKQVQAAITALRITKAEPLSDEIIKEYFKELYWVKGEENLDKKCIMSRIAEGGDKLSFPFAEIARTFKFIKDSISVIIPWKGEGEELAARIRQDGAYKSMHRAAQPFTVSVYEMAFQKLIKDGNIETVNEQYHILSNTALYSEETGLNTTDTIYRNPESMII